MSTYPSVVVYDMYYSCSVVLSVYFRYISAYNVIGHVLISRRWWYTFCDMRVWVITCEHGISATVVVYSMSTRLVCTSSEVEQSSP